MSGVELREVGLDQRQQVLGQSQNCLKKWVVVEKFADDLPCILMNSTLFLP